MLRQNSADAAGHLSDLGATVPDEHGACPIEVADFKLKDSYLRSVRPYWGNARERRAKPPSTTAQNSKRNLRQLHREDVGIAKIGDGLEGADET